MFATDSTRSTSLMTLIVAAIIGGAVVVAELGILTHQVAGPTYAAMMVLRSTETRPAFVEELTVRAPSRPTTFVSMK